MAGRRLTSRPALVELETDVAEAEDDEEEFELEELVRALQRIPETQREAIVMRELEGRSYREIAVFMRINALSRTLESAFLKHSVPYQIVRGLAFFERKENRDILAYLRLILNPRDAVVRVTSTANADNPLTKHQVPLLTCDVWEHAYYLDYRSGRAEYLKAFLGQLVNWERVADSLERLAQTLAAVEQPPRHLRGVPAGKELSDGAA